LGSNAGSNAILLADDPHVEIQEDEPSMVEPRLTLSEDLAGTYKHWNPKEDTIFLQVCCNGSVAKYKDEHGEVVLPLLQQRQDSFLLKWHREAWGLVKFDFKRLEGGSEGLVEKGKYFWKKEPPKKRKSSPHDGLAQQQQAVMLQQQHARTRSRSPYSEESQIRSSRETHHEETLHLEATDDGIQIGRVISHAAGGQELGLDEAFAQIRKLQQGRLAASAEVKDEPPEEVIVTSSRCETNKKVSQSNQP